MRMLLEWSLTQKVVFMTHNHLLVVNCLKLLTLKFFYTIAFMRWFTEFMELFLSVWELIKTLNLYFVYIFEHNL